MTTDALAGHIAAHGTGEDLRTLVLTELAAVREELRLIRPLVTTRQTTLGFLSVEAAKVQDDLIREERADRARHARDGVKVSGAVAAPGSINAFSLLAEWDALLADIEQSIAARALRARVCLVATRPAGPDDSEAARYQRVVELVAVLNRDVYLRRIHTDLVDLHTRITRCIDGNQVKALPDPCPWCGRMTLVVDMNEWVATCGRDPQTGEFEPCVCSDSYCQCKTKPRTYRHTWEQRAGNRHLSTSLNGLAAAIAARSRNTDGGESDD